MVDNFLAGIPDRIPSELIETVLESPHVRVERIVSDGHASPDGFWYDQGQAEWVILLQGEARLEWADQTDAIHLGPGDHVNIPSGRKHRVQWTSQSEKTIWLAVFYDES